jgi:predicted Zn finger-like uncharacterized protein
MSDHLQTQCPHCHSVFRLGADALAQADGQVRCGHCLAVFYAEVSEFEPEDNLDNDGIDSIRYETADDPFSNTHDTLQDAIAADNFDENPADSPHDDYAVADVIPAELRAQSAHSKGRGFFGKLFISLAVLLCLAAGALQYAWYNRAELVKINQLRPWLEQACELAQCTLPQARDPSQFLLSSKNIFTHPNEKNALMVSATIINQADFAQAYPLIELRFANVRGQTIAARRFSAEEYLGIDAEHISLIPAHTPISFNLEIVDPGENMISYEFEFL